MNRNNGAEDDQPEEQRLESLSDWFVLVRRGETHPDESALKGLVNALPITILFWLVIGLLLTCC